MNKMFSSFFSTRWFGRRFNDYAQRCVQSGFIPRRSALLAFFVKYAAKVWMRIQVGKVTVVGAENLHGYGRKIFCGNHSCYFDAPVLFSIFPKAPRFMTAVEEMRGMGGWKGVFMGLAGAYPVDRSNGKTVIDPSIDLMVGGEDLAIMPEAKISETGEYLRFKTGSARIAIGACDRMYHQVKVAVVPFHICFGKRDVATAGGPFSKMGWKWRGGVTVTFGKPIYIHNVEPLTPKNVTFVVRASITRQQCATTSERSGSA